jgi:hypothetical protein
MIKSLIKALRNEGFECVNAAGGFIIRVPFVMIAIGKDPDHDSFMVSIEDSHSEDVESTSFFKLTHDEVLDICAPYKQAQSVAPVEAIETPLVVG